MSANNQSDPTSSTNNPGPPPVLNNLFGTVENPSAIIIVFFIIIFFFIVFSYLGGSSSEQESGSNSSSSMSSILFLFIIFAIAYALYIFFGINVFQKISQLIFLKRDVNLNLDFSIDKNRFKKSTVPELKFKPQTFNIPGNTYNYTDAKALCTAYGARLATYEEVEDAYNSGGEWCNYGWSSDQMALYPTQKSTYENLQKIPGHERDCGRPGVNGGFIEDPETKFGVNCFGYKPKITQDEQDLMANSPPYPINQKDIDFENRVQYWRDNIKDILVSPFNHDNWSKL
jgi:hypothetical protein